MTKQIQPFCSCIHVRHWSKRQHVCQFQTPAKQTPFSHRELRPTFTRQCLLTNPQGR